MKPKSLRKGIPGPFIPLLKVYTNSLTLYALQLINSKGKVATIDPRGSPKTRPGSKARKSKSEPRIKLERPVKEE